VLVSPNMTYPQKVLADANIVLQGAPYKPASDAKASEGIICELFTICQKREAAKPETAEIASAEFEIHNIQMSMDHDTTIEETQAYAKQTESFEKQIAKAKEDIAKYTGQNIRQTTSMMGLEKPLFRLKNPGIISIPLGFLMVILFSLLTRDKRAEDLWEELYVRQNTGLHVEDVSH
jgi:cation/acetate symporter